jgi:Cys-tRNA(Pro)/Cys-tRNA(Cys) deacylase
MTPAIRAAERAGIPFRTYQYEHDSASDSYGEEALRALDLEPERVFKTLLAKLDGRVLVVALVPARASLNLKALASVCGAKRAVMASPAEAERATGYVVGGISPLGQRQRLRTIVDESALGVDTVYVSGGRRGLELALRPADLVGLTGASAGAIARM